MVVVLDRDMAAQRGAVPENSVAAHVTVMRHMRIGHEQIAIPRSSRCRRRLCAAGMVTNSRKTGEPIVRRVGSALGI